MIIRAMSVLMVLGWCATGVAEEAGQNKELTDAKEILKRADAAMRSAKTAQYDGEYKATGWVEESVPTVTGSAVIGPLAEYDVPVFFTKVTIQKSGSEEKREVRAGCDGNEFYLLDPETKKAHHDMDPAVLGTGSRDVQRLILPEFSAKDPLKEELEAEKVELRKSEEIDGVDCYQVYVDLGDGMPRAKVWFISKEDFFPRRTIRVYKNDEGKDGTTELTMKGFSASESFTLHPFKLVAPRGYTLTDEFAP